MKDLTKTAKILSKVLRILSIMVDIAAVCMVVSLGIVAAGFLFDLDPSQIGTNFEQATLGFMTFSVADAYLPDTDIILGQAAAEMFFALMTLIVTHFVLRCFRNILQPMTAGEPFHNTISINLKKLANYTCSLGIALNLQNIICDILLIKAFDLPNLLVGEKITRLGFDFQFDLSFLMVSGVFLLLSYVFRYGEELQQLSDETL